MSMKITKQKRRLNDCLYVTFHTFLTPSTLLLKYYCNMEYWMLFSTHLGCTNKLL